MGQTSGQDDDLRTPLEVWTENARPLSGWGTEGMFDTRRAAEVNTEWLVFMSAETKRLVGKPIDNAIRALGFPSDEKTIAGRRLVFWDDAATDGRCRITAELEKARRVSAMQLDGSRFTCTKFERLLRAEAERRKTREGTKRGLRDG
jgi:hypothetical protein